jgi:hypothetical protein
MNYTSSSHFTGIEGNPHAIGAGNDIERVPGTGSVSVEGD